MSNYLNPFFDYSLRLGTYTYPRCVDVAKSFSTHVKFMNSTRGFDYSNFSHGYS
jgi:hypothetical protein